MAKLKALKIKSLTKPGDYNDGNGLYLQIRGPNSRSWLFRFKLSKRPREMGLGKLEAGDGDGYTLAEARELAVGCRRQLRDGIDPIEARRTKRDADRAAAAAPADRTFEAIAKAYIAAHEPGWKHKAHRTQWRTRLETYAYPKIGAKDVAAITPADVAALLKPIWIAKVELASKLRGSIERILDYAKAQDLRDGENPATLRANLEHMLPKRKKKSLRVRHHPSLPWQQLPDLMLELQQQGGRAAAALEFLILTAARTAETIGTPKAEIDRKAKVWNLPGERMKSHREHRVPLSEPALAVVEEMWPVGAKPTALLFPGSKPGKPLSNMSMAGVLKTMKRTGITVHGFRSTFRDWVSEATDYPGELAEAALSHLSGDETVAAYARSDLFEKRRKLMEDWGAFAVSKR